MGNSGQLILSLFWVWKVRATFYSVTVSSRIEGLPSLLLWGLHTRIPGCQNQWARVTTPSRCVTSYWSDCRRGSYVFPSRSPQTTSRVTCSLINLSVKLLKEAGFCCCCCTWSTPSFVNKKNECDLTWKFARGNDPVLSEERLTCWISFHVESLLLIPQGSKKFYRGPWHLPAFK